MGGASHTLWIRVRVCISGGGVEAPTICPLIATTSLFLLFVYANKRWVLHPLLISFVSLGIFPSTQEDKNDPWRKPQYTLRVSKHRKVKCPTIWGSLKGHQHLSVSDSLSCVFKLNVFIDCWWKLPWKKFPMQLGCSLSLLMTKQTLFDSHILKHPQTWKKKNYWQLLRHKIF